MNKNLSTILEAIGCNKAEITTFQALWQYQAGATVLVLSRQLNLPRPTIYSHLDSLMLLGLIKKGLKENGAIFYPASKEDLLDLVDMRINALKKSKNNIELENISLLTLNRKPSFIVYEGPKAHEHIFNDMLRTREETHWLWPIKKMLEIIPEKTLADFHEQRIKRKIWMNVIWPHNGTIELEKYPRLLPKEESASLRRIKILPSSIRLPVGYGIYGNKSAFISQGTEDYGFIIDSLDLSTALKSQFDHFWDISKKYSKK